jgi:hypothetical protein
MIKTIKIGAKTSQILGKNLAKVKGGNDYSQHVSCQCVEEYTKSLSRGAASSHKC